MSYCLPLPDSFLQTPAAQYDDVWTNAQITTAGYYSTFADGQEAVLSSNVSSTCTNTYTFGFGGFGGFMFLSVAGGVSNAAVEGTGPAHHDSNNNTRYEVRSQVTETCRIDFVESSLCTAKPPPSPPPPSPPPPSPPPSAPACVVKIELVLVLDKSGSVRAEQSSLLAFAREMVSQFSLDATEGARVGVVEFSSDAATLTPLTGSLSEVLTAIDGASAAGGGTSVSDGLELGRVEVNQSARADVPRTILLLTDGVQTVDGNDDTAIAKAAVVKQDGISIVAVGFGGANEQTMRAIASAPSSDFAFFGASMDEVRQHFASGQLRLWRGPRIPRF